MQYAFDVVDCVNVDLRKHSLHEMLGCADKGLYVSSLNPAHRAVLDKLVNKR